MIEFKRFPKIPRFENQSFIITEKIDGTNAAVIIDEEGNIAAQSRTRIITPGKLTDNFGFAAFVEDNKEELLKLGPGHHYGEWWGEGIQRTYGLTEKRFSLFAWWTDEEHMPSCCHRIPVFHGVNSTQYAFEQLIEKGSLAVPGYMNPEGLVVKEQNHNVLYKVILEK